MDAMMDEEKQQRWQDMLLLQEHTMARFGSESYEARDLLRRIRKWVLVSVFGTEREYHTDVEFHHKVDQAVMLLTTLDKQAGLQ